MAKVSERIGADMRTTTYAHMMKQSLEYFGGKRTGDLMSRIGAGTRTASTCFCRCTRWIL